MIDRKSLLAPVFLLLLLLPAGLLAQAAPGGPGNLPTWTSASKEGIGTSITTQSKVWFTLEGGRLTEVYYPRLDTADVRTLEFAVSNGKRVWLESRDMHHAIEHIDNRALLFRQINTDAQGHFTITKTYATDPDRSTLLINVAFSGPAGDSLYVLYHPALDNSGYGNTGLSDHGALVAEKPGMASALVSSVGFEHLSNGFQGVNDGYTDLLLHHRLTWSYSRANNGNVIQVARIDSPAHFTLALGFGPTPQAAIATARASLARGFAAIRTQYAAGWHHYLTRLHHVSPAYEREFELAAMVVRAHEDKTYRGAIIASMTIPWGFAVSSAKPTVGGYHLVWARDLYEAASSLMVAGDRITARRALNYLYNVQQRPNGSFPQNSWLDGRPYGTAEQMDEDSYPMILAWQLGETGRATWEKHVRPEADFVVSHGPATQEERWEEVPGYSPSTIAAEIAGLVCASAIARKNGATADATKYMKTADDWAAHLKQWLVTTTGDLGTPQENAMGYFIRIGNNTNPNDGYMLNIHNGGGVWNESDIVDAGFLELVRLGILPANNPTIENSLKVIDRTIRVETPFGPGFHRYNHDGYGETFYGGPWRGKGIGRLWPLLTGERGEYEIELGHSAKPYIEAMLHFANAGGMIPEQVWDRANPTHYHFVFGQGTGSATPLVWSMAQFMRLVIDAQAGRIVEQPAIVADHFLKHDRN